LTQQSTHFGAVAQLGRAPDWQSGGRGFDPHQLHHPFISGLDFPQVAEGRCGYAGSNKAFSVERNSVGKEQLLEPLSLFEGRLNPEVRGARQNAFCKRQDAFYIEFFELT
jgi:hypothetical protein